MKYQNTYSVNALLSLGIAINESAWGTSSICLTKNNIFGLNAVDSSPDDAYAFPSIDDCIREFMDYQMANAYLKDGQWSNHGEYLGNKGGGINVSYASDPYWGEKAAAHAWNLDALGGGRDYLSGTGGTEEDPVTPPETEEPTTPPAAGRADDAARDGGADNTAGSRRADDAVRDGGADNTAGSGRAGNAVRDGGADNTVRDGGADNDRRQRTSRQHRQRRTSRRRRQRRRSRRRRRRQRIR